MHNAFIWFVRWIKKVIKSRTWGSRSSKHFVEYLRNNGAKLGSNVKFRYLRNTIIDLTRLSLIEIGDNVDIMIISQ